MPSDQNQFKLKKRRLQETLALSTTTCKMAGMWGVVGLFFQAVRDRMRENSLKWHQRTFRLDIRGNFFIIKAVKLCNRLPREVVKQPYLKVFRCANVANRDMV